MIVVSKADLKYRNHTLKTGEKTEAPDYLKDVPGFKRFVEKGIISISNSTSKNKKADKKEDNLEDNLEDKK